MDQWCIHQWYSRNWIADDGFGNLMDVPREPFVLRQNPRFPGETMATGPYAFVINNWRESGWVLFDLWPLTEGMRNARTNNSGTANVP